MGLGVAIGSRVGLRCRDSVRVATRNRFLDVEARDRDKVTGRFGVEASVRVGVKARFSMRFRSHTDTHIGPVAVVVTAQRN